MTNVLPSRLLAVASALAGAHDFSELVKIAHAEVVASMGYRHVWLRIASPDGGDKLQLVELAGDRSVLREAAPVMSVTGDRFLEDVMASIGPVVVEDARTDARMNKALVNRLQPRTIVAVPLRPLGQPLGFLAWGRSATKGAAPRPRPSSGTCRSWPSCW